MERSSPGPATDYAQENNFDALRLVFAYAVVVFHLFVLTGNWSIDKAILAVNAGLAVDGFFVVSGFLITWSLHRDASLRHYAIKRFLRIYPLYGLMILAQFGSLLMLLGSDLSRHVREAARYLFSNLVFAGFMQPTIGDALAGLPVNAINGSLWTLKLEALFYLLLPALLLACRRFGAGVLIAPYLLLALLGHFVYQHYRAVPVLFENLLEFRYFFCGIGLYFYGGRLLRFRRRFLPLGLAAALASIGSRLAAPHAREFTLLFQLWDPLLVGLMVFCLAFAGYRARVKYDLSYGAYIIHFPFIQLSLSYGVFAGAPFYVFFLYTVVTVTLLAWLSYRFIERPAIEFGRKLTRRAPGDRQW